MLDLDNLQKLLNPLQDEKKSNEQNKKTYNKSEFKILEKERERREKEKQYYNNLLEAISKSQHLRSEILKGAKSGLDAETLLLKAIDCITLMGNDEAFKKSFYRHFYNKDK